MSTTRLAVSVVCPVCDSALNVGCRDPKGRPIPPHAERVAKARALDAGRKPRKRSRKRPIRPVVRKPRRQAAPVKVIRPDGTSEIVSQRSLRSKRAKS